MKRVSFAAKLTLLAATLAGCQRGCLSTWWESHTSGGTSQQNPTIPPEQKPGCVAGLVRCSAATVQASRAEPNSKCTPEGCICPWDDVGKCAHGCTLEGVPFEMSADAGVVQLCVPDDDTKILSLADVVQPRDGGDVACEMEGFFCRDGHVSSCASPHAITCLHGCADLDEMQLDDDDSNDLHAAALILCARK